MTNDRRLRRECQDVGLDVLWGLEIMIDLVHAGRLPREDAIEVAEAIRAANPFYVTEEILEEFRERTRSARS